MASYYGWPQIITKVIVSLKSQEDSWKNIYRRIIDFILKCGIVIDRNVIIKRMMHVITFFLSVDIFKNASHVYSERFVLEFKLVE